MVVFEEQAQHGRTAAVGLGQIRPTGMDHHDLVVAQAGGLDHLLQFFVAPGTRVHFHFVQQVERGFKKSIPITFAIRAFALNFLFAFWVEILGFDLSEGFGSDDGQGCAPTRDVPSDFDPGFFHFFELDVREVARHMSRSLLGPVLGSRTPRMRLDVHHTELEAVVQLKLFIGIEHFAQVVEELLRPQSLFPPIFGRHEEGIGGGA